MRRIVVLLLVIAVVMVMAVPAAFAHMAPPCNDTNADGSPSGHEYAQHHIVPMAKAGALGNEGHKPGAHRGFSVCLNG
jgi:hypothetical protein